MDKTRKQHLAILAVAIVGVILFYKYHPSLASQAAQVPSPNEQPAVGDTYPDAGGTGVDSASSPASSFNIVGPGPTYLSYNFPEGGAAAYSIPQTPNACCSQC